MADDLKIVPFDSETLVFNPVSWQTHLLNNAAAQALAALASAPRSLDELVAIVLGPAADSEANAQDVTMIETLLAELETLGLIESDVATPCD
jgi:PqqD family protein of HPr-rel-A system